MKIKELIGLLRLRIRITRESDHVPRPYSTNGNIIALFKILDLRRKIRSWIGIFTYFNFSNYSKEIEKTIL